ncbi:MAG: hypothetical protein ACLPID_13870 [Beijerinckiaceae bacterium]
MSSAIDGRGVRGRPHVAAQGLMRFVAEQLSFAKVRPDMKVVFIRGFENMAERLDVTRRIL